MKVNDNNIDIEERIRILKKFRSLLFKQREKLQKYLQLLESQEKSIEDGDIDTIEYHVSLDKSIVRELHSFQKVIVPFEELYRHAYPDSHDNEIPQLKQSIDTIKEQVVLRNKQNRELLKEKMEEIRQEIKDLKIPRNLKSLYGRTHEPSMVDITM